MIDLQTRIKGYKRWFSRVRSTSIVDYRATGYGKQTT